MDHKDEERIKRIWEYLNEEGIYTEEELDERIRTMEKINIGPFILPPSRTISDSTG